MAFKEKLQKMMARVRLLTLLILVAALTFMVRIGDTVVTMRSLDGAAFAEEAAKEPAKEPVKEPVKEEVKDKVQETTDTVKTDAAKAAETAAPPIKEVKDIVKNVADSSPSADILKSQEDIKKEAETKKEDTAAAAVPAANTGEEKKWQDATDTDTEFPEIKKEMYQDLIKRRQELDDKEKALLQREALLDASQKEIDHKYKEMVGLRDEIQNLLKKQSAEEEARLDSLVKIYSGMKPKDAARIFNTLDMDILLPVISKMPETKSSLIIASMDADPARALTTMLAEQKKLPSLPQ